MRTRFVFFRWKGCAGEVSHLLGCERRFDPGRARNGSNVRTMRTRFSFSRWKGREDGFPGKHDAFPTAGRVSGHVVVLSCQRAARRKRSPGRTPAQHYLGADWVYLVSGMVEFFFPPCLERVPNLLRTTVLAPKSETCGEREIGDTYRP